MEIANSERGGCWKKQLKVNKWEGEGDEKSLLEFFFFFFEKIFISMQDIAFPILVQKPKGLLPIRRQK